MIRKQFHNWFWLTALLVTATGCGTKYPNVSGKITVEGQPIEGVNVIFVPVSTTENPFPGPYAEGVTNSAGTYSLVTRDGTRGATPGLNKVELYIGGSIELEFMRSQLEQLQSEADGDVDHPAYQTSEALNRKIDTLESNAKKGRLEPNFATEFNVPEAGTESANFELTELGETK